MDDQQINLDNLNNSINTMYSHRLVAFQEPTVTNNYTWYRKYADGWVEQGGKTLASIYWYKNGFDYSVKLPVRMKDTNYHVLATMSIDTGYWGAPGCRATSSTVDAISIGLAKPANCDDIASAPCYWEVKGMYK